jgi:multidrug efflux pump subunit AcrB
LAISCVFTSVIFLKGPAKYLFTPLGLAVVFAMLASYGLSRTLTPITIGLLLKGEVHSGNQGWFSRLNGRLEQDFQRMRNSYAELLAILLARRLIVPIAAAALLALGAVMFLFVGRDFFPAIDGGQIQLHVRVPAGTRIEKTEQMFQQIEDKIREIIPASERALIVDNIGLPA